MVATARAQRGSPPHSAGRGIALLIVVVAVAVNAASRQLTAAVSAVVTAAIPVLIARGVVRLLREQGVTGHAVAGGLAIYLSIGLVFAWIIGFVAPVDSTPCFAQHTSATEGTGCISAMTTTGFGDFSDATPSVIPFQ